MAPRFLVVLDLNGTLLHSAVRPLSAPERAYDVQARKKFLYFRPGLKEFLQRLYAMADVGVWTSAIRANADAIVDAVWTACELPPPLFVMSREQCELVPGPGYRSIKDLRMIWRSFPAYSQHNTIILDDTDSKVQRQPQNLLRVPEYNCTEEDSVLLHTVLPSLQQRINRDMNQSS